MIIKTLNIKKKINKQVENSNLFASVAFFSELYNNSKNDIFDIIGDFIFAIINNERKYSFTSSELKMDMDKIYGFDIPEGVIRTVLIKRLSDKLQRTGEFFYYNPEEETMFSMYDEKFEQINLEQNTLLNTLLKFIEEKKECILQEEEITKVKDQFNNFLMDNGYADEYSNFISAFIVKNEDNSAFNNTLSSIKEGLILYNGIKYTPDLNNLGKWNHKLTIYLGTEYLFNAVGYNGIIFQEIFNDFHNLVKEINQNSKSGEKIIILKYFPETKNEISRFFNSAEQIKKGKIPLNVARSAMVNILKNTSNISDIIAKKAKFFQNLSNLGIYEDDYECSYRDLNSYNLEDITVLEELKNQNEKNGRDFDEQSASEILKIFTKINCLRRGDSSKNFEKIGFIYITETSLARFLGHSKLVKIGDNGFSFCKEMDFLTTKFWFTLNKGFSGKINIPTSFDVINKAKIILSSHIANSVSRNYDNLMKKAKNGEITEAEGVALNFELRNQPNFPDNVDQNNIDSSLEFLEKDDYLENFYNDILKKDILLEEKEKELEKFREKEKEEKNALDNKLLEEKKIAFAEKQLMIEKKESRYRIIYLVKGLLPDIMIVFLSFILFRIESFNKLIKSLDANSTAIFFAFVFVLLLINNFIKIYLIDKDKVKNGFNEFLLLNKKSKKKYKIERLDYYKTKYNSEI